jgi:hypothetical protein
VWRHVWWRMPARLALLVSPGLAVLLLWAVLLRVGTRGDRLPLGG